MSLAQLDEFRFGEQRRVAQKTSMDKWARITKDSLEAQTRRWALEDANESREMRNTILWIFGIAITVIGIGVAASYFVPNAFG